MSDEPTQNDSIQPPSGGPSIRLVPLSDIDAFVEVRAGSILDEAAILAIQFLGERDKARTAFVKLAMEHFDAIGAKYDEIRWETAMRGWREAMRAAREAAKAKAVDEAGAEKGPGEPEKKDE